MPMKLSEPTIRRAPPLVAGAAALLGAMAIYNDVRARRAEARHPPLGRMLHLDGGELHVVERGGGETTVVLIHGNGAMIEDMTSSGLVDDLARDHRVVLLDRPGFGHSARPRGIAWTPAAQARLLGHALHHIGVERATVVGHSFAAQVVAELALADPGLVGALVLMSGYLFPSARLDFVAQSVPAIPGLGDAIAHTLSPPLSAMALPGFYEMLFGPAPIPERFMREFPHALALRPGQLRATAADTAYLIPGALRLRRRYADLAMPVTIVTGLEDRIASPDQSHRLHEALPGSRLLAVPGAGHMIHHAATASVADAIRVAAA